MPKAAKTKAKKKVIQKKSKPVSISKQASIKKRPPPKLVSKLKERNANGAKAKEKVKEKEKKLKSARNNGVESKPAKIVRPVKPAAPRTLTPELRGIRQRLSTMLVDLRKDIDHEVRGASERDLAHINDTSDMASDAAEGDLALRIAESETAEAGEIERAIEKIDTGTYGICEMCNKPIGSDRLQFLPYVTMCIKCQELAEIRKREEGDELADLSAEGGEGEMES